MSPKVAVEVEKKQNVSGARHRKDPDFDNLGTRRVHPDVSYLFDG